MFDNEADSEEVMQVQEEMTDTVFHDEMDNEMWYVFYTLPSNPYI